jgi:23S rRNA (uracil1939-C5)-methyltransferase
MDADLIDIEIVTLGAQGDGIATVDGAALFVSHTVPGDRVRARRLNAERALPVEWLARGPTHATPPCPHFGPGKCGGCALQHLTDTAYATWKVEVLTTTLARGNLSGLAMQPLARTPPGARRRAEFLVRLANRQTLVGFHVRASHEAVDIGPCPVLMPALEALLPELRRCFASLWRQAAFDVLVTAGEAGSEIVLTRAPVLDARTRDALVRFAAEAGLARVAVRPGPHAAAEIVMQRSPLRVSFGGIAVDLPPGAFLQASEAGEQAIRAAVTAGLGKARRVADLFAGAGAIALPLAAGRQIYAADRNAEAIAALDGAARRSGLGTRMRAETRDLTRRPLTGDELEPFEAVVFDPPREGAAEQARTLAGSRVPVAIAVSCNPATFVRDAQTLIAGGYRLESVTPIDQFLWSPHLELVGVFRRRR